MSSKRQLRSWLLLLVLEFCCWNATPAADLAGNWSDVSSSRTNSSGFTLSVQKSGANYSCFIDDYDLDFVDYYASHTTFSPSTSQFHIDWAAPGGFSFDGSLSADGNTLNCFLSNAFGIFPMSIPREPSLADFAAGAFTNANGVLPYRLFVPPNYQSANRYPLVLFLHGAGERGTDNAVQVTANIGFQSFISYDNLARHPCFLVAPQCPAANGAVWADPIRRVQLQGLLLKVEAGYSIDTNRVYVTGLSMGGIGAWDQIAYYPSVYAAAVPLSGFGDITFAPQMAQVPVWDFQAYDDLTVPAGYAEATIGAVRSFGGTPIYTEYATGGHPIWSIAYYTPSLVDWVMAQRSGQPQTGYPRASITAPTTNATFATGSTHIDLAGTAGDATAAIVGLNLYNILSGAATLVAGTTNWMAADVGLVPGGTNRILVTAFGTSWAPILGGNTSFSTSLVVTQEATPIRLTISSASSGIYLNWAGGVPPYVIQQRTNLLLGAWQNLQTNAADSITLPNTIPTSFYRVRGQ